MIVDDQRKFVFIHIPKTGGTSITLALGNDQRPRNPHHVAPDTPRIYADYLRFCFVRNPWDRLYSSFNYARKMAAMGVLKNDPVRMLLHREPDLPFEDFVMDFMTPKVVKGSGHFRPQMRWITLSAPQFIGRVETLDTDLGFLAAALGIQTFEMPHVNRSSDRPYHAAYTGQMVKKVAGLYARDIDTLGYTFV